MTNKSTLHGLVTPYLYLPISGRVGSAMTEIVAYLAQKGSTMKVSVVDPNRSGTQMSFNAHQISIDDTLPYRVAFRHTHPDSQTRRYPWFGEFPKSYQQPCLNAYASVGYPRCRIEVPPPSH